MGIFYLLTGTCTLSTCISERERERERERETERQRERERESYADLLEKFSFFLMFILFSSEHVFILNILDKILHV